MKQSVVTIVVLSSLLVTLGFGCAVETGADDKAPIEVTKSALLDDGEISPGCPGYLGECRDGNEKMCKKYSQRCEVRIGVIGDSMSDEYQGSVGLPGVQWTPQVQDDVRISIGTPENNPTVRGEPRNDGFSLNWARFGQAALDIQWNHPAVIAVLDYLGIPQDPRVATIGSFDAQIAGLGQQIAAGEVDIALVWIGHNDLFIRQYIGYDLDEGGEYGFYNSLVTKIVTAAVTLRAYASADPEDIKAKVAIMGLAGDASVLNPTIAAAAAGAGITFIDPFNEAATAMVSEQAMTGGVHVGEATLIPFDLVYVPEFVATPKVASAGDLDPSGTGPCGYLPPVGIVCSTPAYAEPFTHYDGVHPNTIYQGLFGNQVITDLNDTFGFAMRTISDEQLLATAGL